MHGETLPTVQWLAAVMCSHDEAQIADPTLLPEANELTSATFSPHVVHSNHLFTVSCYNHMCCRSLGQLRREIKQAEQKKLEKQSNALKVCCVDVLLLCTSPDDGTW